MCGVLPPSKSVTSVRTLFPSHEDLLRARQDGDRAQTDLRGQPPRLGAGCRWHTSGPRPDADKLSRARAGEAVGSTFWRRSSVKTSRNYSHLGPHFCVTVRVASPPPSHPLPKSARSRANHCVCGSQLTHLCPPACSAGTTRGQNFVLGRKLFTLHHPQGLGHAHIHGPGESRALQPQPHPCLRSRACPCDPPPCRMRTPPQPSPIEGARAAHGMGTGLGGVLPAPQPAAAAECGLEGGWLRREGVARAG